MPPMVLRRDGALMERGAERYGDGLSSPLKQNWMKGQPLSWYYGSILTHTMAVGEGDESEDHLAAIRWNAMAFMWTLAECRAGRLPAELVDMPYALPPTSPFPMTAREFDLILESCKKPSEQKPVPPVPAREAMTVRKFFKELRDSISSTKAVSEEELSIEPLCPRCGETGTPTHSNMFGCGNMKCSVIDFDRDGTVHDELDGVISRAFGASRR